MDSPHPASPSESVSKPRRRGSCLANLLLLALGVVLALGMMEIGLRIVLRRSKQLEESGESAFSMLHTSDDVLLYRHRPGAHATYTQAEFSVDVSINSHGLRDVERAYDKPDGVFRVFILGDSFMAALQVNREDALPAQLEARLNADPCTAESGYRFEVLNGGVSGYNTLDEYLLLREEAIRYSPDLVLYAFVVNDTEGLISPERSAFGETFYALADESGNLVLDENGEPQLIREPLAPEEVVLPGSPGPVEAWLIAHSYLYGFLYPILQRVRPLQRAALNQLRAHDRPVFYEGHYALNPDVPGYPESWTALEQLVLLMNDTSASTGACFGTFTIPDMTAVYPEVASSYYLGFDLLADHWQVDKQERALTVLHTAHAIPLLLLREPLIEAAAKSDDLLYLPFNRHWSAAGHAAAADSVYQWLIDEHLVPTAGDQAVRCGAE
jgi:lysophospholipase L1-like esterase